MIFLEFSGEEKLPGHMAHSPSAPGGGSSVEWFVALPGDTRVVYSSGHVSHPEIIRGKTRARHVAHSAASGRVLSAGVLGDKCLFRKTPGGWSGSLPVRVSVWAPGRVALLHGIRGGNCLGFGTRGRWRARASSGRVLQAWGIREHVALSEGRTEGSLGVAFGTHGMFRR